MSHTIPSVFAVKHKREEIVASSRSGGFFTAISDEILKDGVVYGCVLTDDFIAIHIRTDNVNGRDRMRGSKYIQSSLGETFRNVSDDLKTGLKVLFTGTSCQIAALNKYLGKSYDNLLCIDIVCHGVPSPLVWNRYLEWQKKSKGHITKVDFRNKEKYGWRDHVETLYFDNGEQVDSRVFTQLFYGHCILRPCCYNCPFKTILHPGDITIADYWGIENAAPEFDDNQGVSLVLVNSEKGKAMFEKVKKDLIWKETKIEDSMQPPLIAPFPKPKNREQFWNDFRKKDFGYIVKKYGQKSWFKKIKGRIYNIVMVSKKTLQIH